MWRDCVIAHLRENLTGFQEPDTFTVSKYLNGRVFYPCNTYWHGMDHANGHEYFNGIPKRTRTAIYSHCLTHAKSKTTSMANRTSLNPS